MENKKSLVDGRGLNVFISFCYARLDGCDLLALANVAFGTGLSPTLVVQKSL